MNINQIIYPEDWEEVELSRNFEEILERFGLGFLISIATPAKILASMARISCEEFAPLNPIRFARLGDSNAISVRRMRMLLPPSSPPEEIAVKIRQSRFTEEDGIITTPPYLDFDARQIGEAPMGLGGKFLTGAEILPRADEQIKQMVEEMENYFNVTKYGAGFKVCVRSLGGTEVLNLASEVRQKIRPRERISIWIIDQSHPNLIPLLAYRLKAGLRKNELIILRVNEGGNLVEGDTALVRAICGLLTQFGQRGKPDASTMIRTFIDKYGGVVSYDYIKVNIPVFPVKVKEYLRFFKIPIGSRSVIRKTDQTFRIIREKIGELSRKSANGYYFVLGSFTREEAEEMEREAGVYLNRDQITAVPCGSHVKAYGNNYYFMTATIVKFTGGYQILRDLFKYTKSKIIPEEVLERVIDDKKSRDITNGLQMASKYLGVEVLDLVKGGQDEE